MITTHSPHIASKFEPASIVRLYSENKYSFASCGGCSELLKSVFDNFGYRLNALSAETFFSDGVFLVEGTSEVLFYTALARELKLDLDRHNISILSVEGVGFKPYVAICNALNISWVLRTDNDIFSKTSVTPVKKYYAGISRGIGIVKDIGDNKTGLIEYWNQHSQENEWPKDAEIPEDAKKLNEYIRTNIKDLGIFLSAVDLENDLASSELKDMLMNHYGKRNHDDLVNAMQKKKAENKYLHPIKDKYGIVRNNQVAILCRSNSTAFKVGENLSTPYKIFEETVLDRDNSEWGRFFRDLISARFDESVFAVDYAEQLFSEELEPQKYRKALALCQSIFSNSFDDFCNAEDKIKELAGLVYAQKETKVALNNLHSVISDPHQLKNYVPARENELNIMTLHKSKGLEFNIVFHMDMYKWIIPNEYGDESSVQQDLNLHYVGLTRAKDACYIMNGTARFRSKKNDYIFAEPSSFLSKPGLAERRKDVRWEM